MEREAGKRDSVAVAAAQASMEALQTEEHLYCLFCGKENPIGFKLDFRVDKPGSVQAALMCGHRFQSYSETLHGGVTSALLDAAMTNALFSLNVVALTGELTVRFLNPVELGREAEVSAELVEDSKPLYKLRAQLAQGGKPVARATAKFVDREWATSEVGGGAASWVRYRGW